MVFTIFLFTIYDLNILCYKLEASLEIVRQNLPHIS